MVQLVDTKPIDKTINRLMEAFKVLGAKAFPATKVAAGKASAFMEQTWVGYASGNPIPGQTKTVDNVDYRNSIRRLRLNEFDWLVLATNDKVATKIEDGTPRVDLKEHLPFAKSYFSKDGTPYSHIPFRHKRADIQKGVPKKVAADVFKMPKSFVMEGKILQ